MQYQGGPIPGVSSAQPSLTPSDQGPPGGAPGTRPGDLQDWAESAPRSRPSPWIIVLALGGLGLGGFGFVKSMMDSKPREVRVTTPTQPSFFSEQSQMMREALDMARQAQALQREHMQTLQGEIQAHESGEFPAFEDEGGGGE